MDDTSSSPSSMNDASMGRFARLWSEHHTTVAAYVHAAVRDGHRAEDVLQDVAEAAIRSFGDFDASRSFVGWVLGIARHRVLDYVRKAGRDRHVFGERAMVLLAEAHEKVAAEQTDFRSALASCIEKLPEKNRAIVELRYQGGLGFDEIAARLSMTANAATVAMHRVRAALNDCVRRHAAGGQA
ncbi:MAG: sigma-70 family RNA polymerase sigma factor [Phycisphaera sp.]|nr:sigma-70 family RNA polymerase sigma factor [Phycisphaera sp.]